jgi:hypothetical protein
VFNLDLHQPARTFKGKHARIGFSPERSMLFVGTSRGKDPLWVAMAPDEFFESVSDNDDLSQHRSTQPSCLQGRHYWMMVMYFAHVITSALPARHIYCIEQYPDLSNRPRYEVENVTNIL